MYITTVHKNGDGLVLDIPLELQQALQLEPGTKLQIGLDERTLRVRRRKYTAEELLAQCDSSLPPSEEDLRWDAMRPVGRELI